MGSLFSESTNAREGRDKGYHGREERIRFTRRKTITGTRPKENKNS